MSYSHHERIVLTPALPVKSRPGHGAQVTLEAVSSQKVNSLGETELETGASPFPLYMTDLARKFRLKRLLLQVGSSSSSSGPVRSHINRLPSRPNDPFVKYVAPSHLTGPSGTSIYAVFSGGDDQPSKFVETRIQPLLRALAGSRLLCGSPLDSVSISKNQIHSYPLEVGSGANETIYHMVLPSYAGQFCFEGITAFRRLLPCGDRAGFFSSAPTSDVLLGSAPKSLLGSKRALWMDLSATGSSCFANDGETDCTLHLLQGASYGVEVGADLNSATYGVIRDEFGPNHTSASLGDFLLGDDAAKDGSLSHCPLADSSTIITTTAASTSSDRFAIPFQGGKKMSEKLYVTSDQFLAHDVQAFYKSDIIPLSLQKKWLSIGALSLSGNVASFLRVDRTVDRHSGVTNHGTFHSVYRNGAMRSARYTDDNTASSEVLLKTFDFYPNFVKPLVQSLTIRLYQHEGAGGVLFVPDRDEKYVDVLRSAADSFEFLPREDGSISLQITINLPPDSSIWIKLEYEPRFFSFEHHPADPNRGIDVVPSYGEFHLHTAEGGGSDCPILGAASSRNPTLGGSNISCISLRLYSPSVIVMPPVPDLSMPFNVVSLTCTLYAFIIGSLINLLVRKSSKKIADKYYNIQEESKLMKIKAKLWKLKAKVRAKFKNGILQEGNKMKED